MIAVGICVGFLPYNFNPARIFMGDAGALFLGLLLATTTITIGGRADYQYPGTTYFFYAPLFIPIVILGVPILDTAFSVVRRVVQGRSFAVADKDHLHHRLMRLGHGPRRTVVILWLWTALLSGLALLPDLHAARATSTRSCRSACWRSRWCSTRCSSRAGATAGPSRRGRTELGRRGPEPPPALGEVVDLESRRRGAG